MRLAPVAMFYARQPEDGIEACGESPTTTHSALEAMDACRYFGGLLIGAINGASKAELLSSMYAPAPNVWKLWPLARGSPDVRARQVCGVVVCAQSQSRGSRDASGMKPECSSTKALMDLADWEDLLTA